MCVLVPNIYWKPFSSRIILVILGISPFHLRSQVFSLEGCFSFLKNIYLKKINFSSIHERKTRTKQEYLMERRRPANNNTKKNKKESVVQDRRILWLIHLIETDSFSQSFLEFCQW